MMKQQNLLQLFSERTTTCCNKWTVSTLIFQSICFLLFVQSVQIASVVAYPDYYCTTDQSKITVSIPSPLPGNYTFGCKAIEYCIECKKRCFHWKFNKSPEPNTGWKLTFSEFKFVNYSYPPTTRETLTIIRPEMNSHLFNNRIAPRNPIYISPEGGEINFCAYSSSSLSMFVIEVSNLTVIDLSSESKIQFNEDDYSNGGFAFFSAFNVLSGAFAKFNLYVNGFAGLKPPKIYIAKNEFPYLDDYLYTNDTIRIDKHYEASYSLSDPDDGNYVLGVFTTGSYADIVTSLDWIYNLTHIEDSVVYEGVVSENVTAYLMEVPENTDHMYVEFSRNEPGGYPSLYVQEGSFPDKLNDNYLFGLVTDANNQYFSKDVPNPNPTGSNHWKPGTYVFRVYSDIPTKESGFYFRVALGTRF